MSDLCLYDAGCEVASHTIQHSLFCRRSFVFASEPAVFTSEVLLRAFFCAVELTYQSPTIYFLLTLGKEGIQRMISDSSRRLSEVSEA
jgi:hypothetical protein